MSEGEVVTADSVVEGGRIVHRWDAYCDGSVMEGHVWYAFIILRDGKVIHKGLDTVTGSTNSNLAEWRAVEAAILFIAERAAPHDRVVIRSDSSGTVAKLKKGNGVAQRAFEALQPFKWKIEKVDRAEVRMADELARGKPRKRKLRRSEKKPSDGGTL